MTPKSHACYSNNHRNNSNTKSVIVLELGTVVRKTLEIAHKECLFVTWTVLVFRLYLEENRFTVRPDLRALKSLLTMTNASGKLAWCNLSLSYFQFSIVHRVRIQHQAAEALSRLLTAGADKKMDKEVAVLNINSKTFSTVCNVETEQKGEKPGEYTTLQKRLVTFLPEVFALADKTEQSKLDIPNLNEFITTQTASNKCLLEVLTVRQPEKSFSYDSTETRAVVTSGRCVPTIRTCSTNTSMLRPYHY